MRNIGIAVAACLSLALALRNAATLHDPGDITFFLAQGDRASLNAAASLNPHSAAPWLSLGLLAEASGRPGESENALVRAVALDRGYLPRWTLANFYLRHDDPRAWPLLAEALKIAVHGGQEPFALFDVCWQFRPEPAFILSQLVGQSPAALRLYVTYLLTTERVSALPEAALLLPASEDALLLMASDQLLKAGDATGAMQVWNHANPPGTPGELLANTAFVAPRQLGFDWHSVTSPECRVEFPQAARFVFTGRQPEILELLYQVVSVPAGNYMLTWQAKQESADLKLSLFWHIWDANTAKELFRTQLQPTADWHTESAQIAIPRDTIARLVLRSERLPGTTRFEGAATLRQPSLRRL